MNSFRAGARAILLVAIAVTFSACVVVEDGEVGISKSFGKINKEPLAPGVHANVPLVREVETWNVKTQRMSRKIDIPSGEGLIIGIEASLLFRPKDVVSLRTKIGPNYELIVLEPLLINAFREVVGKERVEDLIKNQERMTGATLGLLTDQLTDRGIVVEDLQVTNLRLPPKVKEAIERKLESEQRALQKEFELAQAKKDAEIEIARAEGVSRAQEIISSTISSAYLQYLWISTLNDNPNVIYVATEANMPMFRSVPTPTPSAARGAQGAK
ncbi:MAG: prohibitin family protein [Bdellovibrionales bacterium]|nr:prohibitin family protein [Bdellovibrionales bacterium]